MHTAIKHSVIFFPVLLIVKSSELAMFPNAISVLTLLAIIQHDTYKYTLQKCSVNNSRDLPKDPEIQTQIFPSILKKESHPHPAIQNTLSSGYIPFLKAGEKIKQRF